MISPPLIGQTPDGVTEALNAAEQEFGYAGLVAEVDRYRDRPLREGLDLIADRVREWSGGSLRDDASLLGVERITDTPP